MARLRASVRGDEEYWTERISGYLQGTHNPQRALPERISYVAVEADVVAGFVAGHLTKRYGCDGELQWINVAAEYRGRGVADELLRLLAGWFVERDARRVCVDVDPANAPARSFYMRNGAKELNEHWLVWDDIGVVPERTTKRV